MTSVAVLGATGMLGHKMVQTLSDQGFDVTGTIRGRFADLQSVGPFLAGYATIADEVDVRDFQALATRLNSIKPDAIVNCVGIIKQKPSAHDHIESITINSLLPHQLHRWSAANGSRLVHFSTDCVFDGSRGGYAEEDPSDAKDLYGRTKYLGEVDQEGAVTLRTSIIGRELYGFHSLVEWFVAQNGGQVEGYAGAIYSGVTTQQAATTVAGILEDHKSLSGLYHLAGPIITKYDLLMEIRRQFQLDISITRNDVFTLDRSLIGDRFAAATGFRPPTWEEMIANMAQDETPYLEMR